MNIAQEMTQALSQIPDQVLHPTFNDDDLYIYKTDTLEIVDVIGCKESSYRMVKASQMPEGYSKAKGMTARYKGLWHMPKADEPRYICPVRSAQVRKEFWGAR